MAHYDGGNDGAEGQVQDTRNNLKAHLSKYNVHDTVYALLRDESITVDELITFTTKDLEDWCNEHSLKTIERRRFLNAVKSLPNIQSPNIDSNKQVQIVRVPVFLGNEEKEQLNAFDEMEGNITKIMNHVKEMKNSTAIDKVIEEINNVCDEIETHVASLRKKLLKQVHLNTQCQIKIRR